MSTATGRFRSWKLKRKKLPYCLKQYLKMRNTIQNGRWTFLLPGRTREWTKKGRWKQLEGTDLRELMSKTCQPHSSTCPQRVFKRFANSFVKWRSKLGNGTLLRRSTYLFAALTAIWQIYRGKWFSTYWTKVIGGKTTFFEVIFFVLFCILISKICIKS